jgi:hypothetical protein
MSCLVPDPQVYEYVLNGLKIAAYRTTCDNLFASCIHQHFKDRDVEEEAPRLIKSWLYLNELPYCVGYNEPYKKSESLYRFIRKNEHHNVQALQLYSYVKCICYNIEMSTIKSKKSYRRGPVENVPEITKQMGMDFALLTKWRIAILEAIVENLPEYEHCQWSEPIPAT